MNQEVCRCDGEYLDHTKDTMRLMFEKSVFIVEMVDVMPLFFFFFQAEDGIRDLTVTGVQTCALPILVFVGIFKVKGEIDPKMLWLGIGFFLLSTTVVIIFQYFHYKKDLEFQKPLEDRKSVV